MPSDIYYSEPISRGFYRDFLSWRSHRERSLKDIIATYYVYRTVVILGPPTYIYIYVFMCVYMYAKATSSSFVQTAHSITFCFPQLHSHVQHFEYLHINRCSIVFLFLRMKYGYTSMQTHSVPNHSKEKIIDLVILIILYIILYNFRF